MASTYHMDLEQFSLEQLRHIVESGDLLPSEEILGGKFAPVDVV